LLGGVLQVARVLEGDDTAQRDEKAEIERLARQVRAAREAMQHAGDAALARRRAEHRRRILLGIAGVDDQRQAGRPRRLDMRREALALGGAVRLVVIIIEPAFADRDDLGVRGAFDKGGGAEIRVRVGLVRMNADARPDVAMPLGGGEDVAPLRLAR
jgi:hypothetical protein